MTAKYLHPADGAGRRRVTLAPDDYDRVAREREAKKAATNARKRERRRIARTLAPEQYRAAVSAAREGERDRAEIERRIAIVRQAKLDHMRTHGYMHLPNSVLDSLGIGTDGRRRRQDSIKRG